MKLAVNNFTGFIDGKRYRIKVSTENGFVTVYLMLEEDGVFWVHDIQQRMYENGYRTYEEALREALGSIENQYSIELVKTELEVLLSFFHVELVYSLSSVV